MENHVIDTVYSVSVKPKYDNGYFVKAVGVLISDSYYASRIWSKINHPRLDLRQFGGLGPLKYFFNPLDD